MYLIRSNIIFRLLYPRRIWKMPGEVSAEGTGAQTRQLYLTFDDGPHPEATRFALDTLKAFQAQATFFCIGKNIVAHPDLFREIGAAGHSVGNHTFQHVNGWKTSAKDYLTDIAETRQLVQSPLFRPPYGRMTRLQQQQLLEQFPDTRIIMWDLLSADFDTSLPAKNCWENVRRYARPGSIIVFHDSTKAFERMRYALPKTLEYFAARGYQFKALPYVP